MKCVFTWQDIFRLSSTLVYICICVCLCVSIPEFIFNMHFFRYTPSCLQLADFPPPHHFCVGICVSVHMELRLRSINVAWGDLWSATGELNAPPTYSAYMLFGCMIYELCPRVAGFIFLLLTTLGLWAPLRRRERESRFFFWPLNTSNESGCPALFHCDGVSKFDVSTSTHWRLLLQSHDDGLNDVMLPSRPHTHAQLMGDSLARQRVLFALFDLMACTSAWEMIVWCSANEESRSATCSDVSVKAFPTFFPWIFTQVSHVRSLRRPQATYL